MPAIRVIMPNGTTKSFAEATPKSEILQAQADMLAEMRTCRAYDGFDFAGAEAALRRKRKVKVTQFAQGDASSRPSPLSPEGSRYLRGIELDSTRMDEENMRRYGVDPATGIYVDRTGNATFGVGHLIPANEVDAWRTRLQAMTPAQRQQHADELYAQDQDRHYSAVRQSVTPQVFDGLSQNQRDALVIDHFNTGQVGPRMNQAIQRGDMDAAADEFNSWNGRVNGVMQIIPGLVNRQLQTREIFRNGRYDAVPSEDERNRILNGARR